MSLDEVHGLYDHFKEYIKEYSFHLDVEECLLTIDYTPWEYDYIDGDLDFDEFAYMAMLDEFDRYLHIMICEEVSRLDGDVRHAHVQRFKMLGRMDRVLDRDTWYHHTGEDSADVTSKSRYNRTTL